MGTGKKKLPLCVFLQGDYSSTCLKVKSLSRVPLFVTLWTVAYQASPSIGFSRQEYWSGLPFLPPGNLLDTGMELSSPASPALAGGFFTTAPPGKALGSWAYCKSPMGRTEP